MASAFERPKPARIRVDTDTVHNVDVVVPCYIVVYPDPADPKTLVFSFKSEHPGQLAEMVAGVIRLGTIHGVMQAALHSLTNTTTQGTVEQHQPKPPGTPLDDLPPHARK